MKTKDIFRRYCWRENLPDVLQIAVKPNHIDDCYFAPNFSPQLPKIRIYKKTGRYEIHKFLDMKSIIYEYVYVETI